MAERLNAAVLKTVEGVSLPGVQIPLPPPKHNIRKSRKVSKALRGFAFLGTDYL